jgi:hypothetical protein
VLSTERTILSPFTKEYRALGTLTGIPQFLDCLSWGPTIKFKLRAIEQSIPTCGCQKVDHVDP